MWLCDLQLDTITAHAGAIMCGQCHELVDMECFVDHTIVSQSIYIHPPHQTQNCMYVAENKWWYCVATSLYCLCEVSRTRCSKTYSTTRCTDQCTLSGKSYNIHSFWITF
jgi:hypothetical protein